MKSKKLVLTIIVIIVLIVVVAGFVVWKIYNSSSSYTILPPVPIQPTVPAQPVTQTPNPVNSPVATATQPVATTPSHVYKIDNINSTFKIKEFPNTDFTLASITKVEVPKLPGCTAELPQEIRDELNITTQNTCWDKSSLGTTDSTFSLVNITLQVANNGFDVVQGDLFRFAYLKGINTNDLMSNLRFATSELDSSSYNFYVPANSDRTVQLYFWVPTQQNETYLLYGNGTSTFEGAIKLDFTTSEVTPNIVLYQSPN